MIGTPPVQLACPRCATRWPLEFESIGALSSCPQCRTPTRVYAFPALARPVAQGNVGEVAVVEGEATCFYHPQKRAHVPCDRCGRFLCALCDCEMGDLHLCPACLESGARKHQLRSFEKARMRWDQVVWTLLIVPLLLCGIIMPITSLIALGLIVLKRKAPGSALDNTRRSLAIASVIAVLELGLSLAGWAYFIADSTFHS